MYLGLHLRLALLQRWNVVNGPNEASSRRHHFLMDCRCHVFHAVYHALSISSTLSRILDIRTHDRRYNYGRFRAWIGHRRGHRFLHGLSCAISAILLPGHDRQPIRNHGCGGVHSQYPGNVRCCVGHADHVPGFVNLVCRLTRLDSGYSLQPRGLIHI